MARFKKQRYNLFRGFIILFCLIILLGVVSKIAKGQDKDFIEKWDLYGDFQERGYILKACEYVNNKQDVENLPEDEYQGITIEPGKAAACPIGKYMLIRFDKGYKFHSCFCLEKMT